MDYNPYLKHWRRPEPNKVAGKGNIEKPGQVKNIVHQTRATPPTDYENQLGQALEEIFADDVTELKDIIVRLNEKGIQTHNGSPWTEELFQFELKRLGA